MQELWSAGVMNASAPFAAGVDVDVEDQPVGTQGLEGGRGSLAFGGPAFDPVWAAAGAVGAAPVADQVEQFPREPVVDGHRAEQVALGQLGDRPSTGLPRCEQDDAD